MREYKWPLNLQLFAEDGDDTGFDDDMSLPQDSDEIEMDPDDFPQRNDEDEAEDTKPADETPQPELESQAKPTIKLKYDSQEREVPLEEAQALAQKGMNYERAVERARQEARDAYIAEQGFEWQGRPITNEAEYKAAIAEKELLDKYQELPSEVAERLVALERSEAQRAEERKAAEEKAKNEADISDFLAYFQEVNGRAFDGTKDKVPPAVFEAQQRGIPLRYAYADHLAKELQSQLQISRQNEENTKKAPAAGSVTGHGSKETEVEDDFLAGFNSI